MERVIEIKKLKESIVMKRKLVSIVLIMMTVLSLINPALAVEANSDGNSEYSTQEVFVGCELDFDINPEKVVKGEEFTLSLEVNDLTDVYAVAMSIKYDPNVMEVVDYNGKPFNDDYSLFTQNGTDEYLNMYDLQDSAVIHYASGLTGDVSGYSIDSMNIAEITFRIKETAVIEGHLDFDVINDLTLLNTGDIYVEVIDSNEESIVYDDANCEMFIFDEISGYSSLEWYYMGVLDLDAHLLVPDASSDYYDVGHTTHGLMTEFPYSLFFDNNCTGYDEDEGEYADASEEILSSTLIPGTEYIVVDSAGTDLSEIRNTTDAGISVFFETDDETSYFNINDAVGSGTIWHVFEVRDENNDGEIEIVTINEINNDYPENINLDQDELCLDVDDMPDNRAMIYDFQNPIVLTGDATGSNVEVWYEVYPGGEEHNIELSENGNFSQSIFLSPGYNYINVIARNEFGEEVDATMVYLITGTIDNPLMLITDIWEDKILTAEELEGVDNIEMTFDLNGLVEESENAYELNVVINRMDEDYDEDVLCIQNQLIDSSDVSGGAIDVSVPLATLNLEENEIYNVYANIFEIIPDEAGNLINQNVVDSSEYSTPVEFTYSTSIWEPSNDTSLIDITLDTFPDFDFNSDKLNYEVLLPYGTTILPTVDAVSADNDALVEITQATGLPGTATVAVTAEDGVSQRTYTIDFVEEKYIDSPVIEIGDVIGVPGGEVTVDISMSQIEAYFPDGIIGLNFGLNYDSSILEIVDVSAGDGILNPGEDFSSTPPLNEGYALNDESVVFLFMDSSGSSSRALKDVEFAEVTFRIKDDIALNTETEISFDISQASASKSGEVFPYLPESIDTDKFEFRNGSITASAKYGDLDGNGSIDVTDLIYMKYKLLGIISSAEFPVANGIETVGNMIGDIDGDGSINVTDLIYMEYKLLNLISEEDFLVNK